MTKVAWDPARPGRPPTRREAITPKHSNVGISSSRPTCRARTTSFTWPGAADAFAKGRASTTSSKYLRRGALSLADYAYSDACVPPAPPQLVARAHDFRVRGLNRVDISRPDDAKGQLARSTPVLISFYASTAFHKLSRCQHVHGSRHASRRQEGRLARDDTGRLRRAAASVPLDQFLESALGRSRLRLDQLRSPADPHQRRLYPRHWPGHAAAISAAATSAATISAAAVSAATISAANPCAAKANPGTV